MGEAAEEIDAEALVKQIEETGSAEPQEEALEEEQAQAEETAAQQMFKYKALGKEIEEPIETILQRASMGYDYAQKMQEYKQLQQQIEEQKQLAEQLQQKWKPYDDYARENPDWFQHWQNAWQNRGSGQQGHEIAQTEQSAIPPQLQEKLTAFEQFMQQQQQREQQQQVAQEDEALANDIKSIQEQYPDIDFQATDPATGKSLEQQVIDHALQNGINSFRAAFRDFNHEKLVERERERAKEDVAKQTQAQRKRGIIGQSPTPFSEGPTNFDVKSRSWDQLERLAAQELGIDV